MALPRAAILSGPCSITYASKVIQSTDEVQWRLDYDTFDIETNSHGFLSRRANDRVGKVTFTPVGVFSAADTDGYSAIFHPYAGTVPGTKLIGSSANKTLDISASDGVTFQAANAVLTKIPDLVLSSNKMIYGGAEFSCVMGAGTPATSIDNWNTADAFLKIGTTPAFSAIITRSRILTLAYTATWGNDIAAAFHTMDGWTISFDLRINPLVIDAYGTVDWTFQDLIVRARCRPIISDADMKAKILAIEDTKMQRGADFMDLTLAPGDLTITGKDGAGTTALVFTLKNAIATQGGFHFSSQNLRPGEVEWVATKTGLAEWGAALNADALYTLAGS